MERGDLGVGNPSSLRCRISPNFFDPCCCCSVVVVGGGGCGKLNVYLLSGFFVVDRDVHLACLKLK